jgi:predicted MFS family arabinose efflux permease
MQESSGRVTGERTDEADPSAPPSVRPVLILALGTFAMGTDSFVLAGILPQISSGLGVSVAAAGQVVTVFALTYAVAAPLVAAATSRVPRKVLTLAALAVFVLANLGSAVSPTFTVLLMTRIAAGIGAALYTPTASAAAAALVPAERRGQALSILLGGLTVGTVLGVPVGTALGQRFSWPATLVFVAGVAAAAAVGIQLRLPSLPALPAVPLRRRFSPLSDRHVVLAVLVMLLESAASIGVYTYTAEVVGDTAALRGVQLAALLLVWGVGGAVGSLASGVSTDRFGAWRTLVGALTVLAATLALLSVTTSVPAVFAVMLLNGCVAWAAATPNNHRLTELAPALPSVVISLNSTGIYLGQAIGAGAGGLLLGAGMPPRLLPLAGATIALVSLGVHALTRRPSARTTA